MLDKNLVINLDKPRGITSQQAVTHVKKIFSVKKAGHAGTLDPIATGILLVCLNEATKTARFLTDMDKEYIALMKLGERTDTLDCEGRIIHTVRNLSLDMDRIQNVLEKFKGPISQTPPMYSAIKINGKPIYKLARKGIEIERKPRNVQIFELEALSFALPFLEIRVVCSKGTYIRALCDDIGIALGVGAHITALQRTRIGSFRIQDSASLEELPSKGTAIITLDKALSSLRENILSHSDFQRVIQGKGLSQDESEFTEESYLRLKDPHGVLFAIGRVKRSKIVIERMLNTINEKTKHGILKPTY